MNRAVHVLMERDGMTKDETTGLLNEVKSMLAECNYDPEESEDIMMSELGLEMDYIFDILG